MAHAYLSEFQRQVNTIYTINQQEHDKHLPYLKLMLKHLVQGTMTDSRLANLRVQLQQIQRQALLNKPTISIFG